MTTTNIDMNADTLPADAHIRTELDRRVKGAREDLAKFAADLAENPAYALQWADKSYDNAAIVQVCTQVLNIMDRTGDLDTVRKEVLGEVLRGSESGCGTSSESKRLMERAILRQWSAVARLLQWGRLV